MTGLSKVGTRYITAVVMVAYLSLWQFRVAGNLSGTAFASFALFVFLYLTYGRAFLCAVSSSAIQSSGVASHILCGFFLVNTLLFLLSLVSTLGMLTNVLILTLLALVLTALFPYPKLRPNAETMQQELPSLLCVIFSGAGATLWCLDSQPMLLVQGPTAIYQTWQDTFIHVREISIFAQAHGIGSIQDIKLSGSAAPIYHFASYLSAAAVSAFTGAPAIDAYSSFQLPLGIFLTGLAAFALIASIWGGWPGLAAAVAVVLLPDAYQQGFANRYLSYNFLAQINLGMLYGIACVAVAWIFILDGCRRGKLLSILIGYVFLAVSLLYKAHLFVANAYLVLIYPCLFFFNIPTRWRIIIGGFLTGLFVSTIIASQNFDRVPVLRLDGSGIGGYIVALINDFDKGLLKSFFTQVFLHEQHSKAVQALYAAAMISLSTFGLWIFVTTLVITKVWAKEALPILSFPLLIVANYLVMAIGLAADARGIGTPDELLNRPMVWAYFAIAAWTAGAGYYLAFGGNLPSSKRVRAALFGLCCVALAGPLIFSRNLQTFPSRQGYANYTEFNAVPLCLVKASQYIRENSRTTDIIQDSENDPNFVVTALSERQLFAGSSLFGGAAKEHQERLSSLALFKQSATVDQLTSYATLNHISWYLLRPSTAASWPASFLDKPVFDCNGFRVYHFGG